MLPVWSSNSAGLVIFQNPGAGSLLEVLVTAVLYQMQQEGEGLLGHGAGLAVVAAVQLLALLALTIPTILVYGLIHRLCLRS